LGPWTGGPEGDERLRLPYRVLLGEQGFGLVYCHVSQLQLEAANARSLRAANTECPGTAYRLLTESEWEYASRAGTTTPFSTGATITTDQANFIGDYTYNGSAKGQYRQRTTEVGSFKPNAFGLYDMHGNVWE